LEAELFGEARFGKTPPSTCKTQPGRVEKHHI
jgi:hypothetical protein